MKRIFDLTHKVLKNIFLLWIGLLSANYCHAQWTKQDSLKLAELLKKEGEIELNPEALQSIDFLKGSIGVETNGTATNGNSGFASPYSDPQHYRRHFDFDETLPSSPFPRVATDTLAKGMHMSLLPYHGIYLYNLNPVSGKRVPMGGMMDRKTYEISCGQIVPGQGGPMNDMRLMMMGGSMGGSFKTDFDQMFSLQYWNFRQRRAANKTLVALAAYNNSEQQCGRYEYFHVDNEEYSLNFVGSDSIRTCVETHLQDSCPVTKGLLYFRYTEMCRGTFAYFFPDGHDVRGTFTTNGTRYMLCYGNGQEVLITITRMGGRLFTVKRDLTKRYRHAYTLQELKKVQIETVVTQIAKGKD